MSITSASAILLTKGNYKISFSLIPQEIIDKCDVTTKEIDGFVCVKVVNA